jgi:hypothetical protein
MSESTADDSRLSFAVEWDLTRLPGREDDFQKWKLPAMGGGFQDPGLFDK